MQSMYFVVYLHANISLVCTSCFPLYLMHIAPLEMGIVHLNEPFFSKRTNFLYTIVSFRKIKWFVPINLKNESEKTRPSPFTYCIKFYSTIRAMFELLLRLFLVCIYVLNVSMTGLYRLPELPCRFINELVWSSELFPEWVWGNTKHTTLLTLI